MVERKRQRSLNVRLLEEEHQMLDVLSEREGLSVSDWVRHTVRTAYRKSVGDVKPRTPKPKTTKR